MREKGERGKKEREKGRKKEAKNGTKEESKEEGVGKRGSERHMGGEGEKASTWYMKINIKIAMLTTNIRRAPQSASVLGELIICSTGIPHDPTSMRLRFQLRIQLRSDCGSDLSSDLSSAPTPLPPHTREGFSLADPPGP